MSFAEDLMLWGGSALIGFALSVLIFGALGWFALTGPVVLLVCACLFVGIPLWIAAVMS